jgi:hypothetical protein
MLKCTMFLLLILGIVSMLTSSVAFAAGVGVSPGRLEFDDSSLGLKTTLHVINTGETKADYEVYAEGEYKDWFQIFPNRFSLPPNGELAVEISLSESAVTLGEHHTNISVVAFDDSEDTAIGSGLKIPVDIHLASAFSETDVLVDNSSHIRDRNSGHHYWHHGYSPEEDPWLPVAYLS